MSINDKQFVLPQKLDAYLATLNRLYASQKKLRIQEILVNGAVTIHRQWSHDNWNGGIDGHALTLTIPDDLYLQVLDAKNDMEKELCEDLNKLNHLEDEFIEKVFIEMQTSETPQWREESGLLRPKINLENIPSESLMRIWGGSHIRVFLSHKAEYKKETSGVKERLGRYGIGCFVAHEDIQPNEEWLREIERALHTMDALVALLTKDFNESDWTDQEVGFALGRDVPVIAVCLGKDPYGFVGKRQGLLGYSLDNVDRLAAAVYQVLHKQLPDRSRLFEAAVSAYAASTSSVDAEWKLTNVLSAFNNLNSAQVEKILQAHRNNSKNLDSWDGINVLRTLLKKWTGQEWVVRNNTLMLEQAESVPKDDIPF